MPSGSAVPYIKVRGKKPPKRKKSAQRRRIKNDERSSKNDQREQKQFYGDGGKDPGAESRQERVTAEGNGFPVFLRDGQSLQPFTRNAGKAVPVKRKHQQKTETSEI